MLGCEQANRINWNNPYEVDFPSLWTVNYVHPSVEAEIERSNLKQAIDCSQSNGIFDSILEAFKCP